MAERRLFQEVADRILDAIKAGVYPPGTRLPGERELSELYNVSRVTIREAAIALQAKGWIRIKTGSGLYALDGTERSAHELPEVSAFELTQARALVEGEAAALAAHFISDDDLSKLESLLEKMGAPDATEERISEADLEFHLIIAAAAQNSAVTYLIRTLWRLRLELPTVRASHSAVCQQDAAARDAEHREIIEALRKRDGAEARSAMRRHFNRLLRSMLVATEEREMAELRRRSEESRARFLTGAL